MKNFYLLTPGKEYYFYFPNYFCSGFVTKITEDAIYITNGHFYYPNEHVYPYGDAFLDPSQILGYATT